MTKSFTLGAAAGMSALSLSVIMLAQAVGAQTASSDGAFQRPERTPPSQECVQALADASDARLANIDSMMAAHKAAMQAHSAALKAAAQISDDDARAEALKAANEAMREAMEAARPDQDDSTREAIKEACGDSMHFMGGGHGGPGMMGGHMKMKMHHGKGMLAEKLGMTQDELKAALEEGKTIEDLAEEAGVELPPRPEMGKRMGGFRFKWHGEDAAE